MVTRNALRFSGAAVQATDEQQEPATAAERSVEAEKKETVPHGRMGGRVDRHLHLHHPPEHRQAVARGRISQGPDMRHAGRGEKGLGQEHRPDHRVRVHTGAGHTPDGRRAVGRATRLSVDQEPTAAGAQIVLQLFERYSAKARRCNAHEHPRGRRGTIPGRTLKR